MEFEVFECISNPNGPYKNTTCHVKKKGWRNLNVNIAANLTRPITDIQVNTVMYFKYSKYQKFPVNIWKDFSDALSGKSEWHSFNWMFQTILQYPNTATNWDHLFPFDGFVYLELQILHWIFYRLFRSCQLVSTCSIWVFMKQIVPSIWEHLKHREETY